jgi:hypothetical protein
VGVPLDEGDGDVEGFEAFQPEGTDRVPGKPNISHGASVYFKLIVSHNLDSRCGRTRSMHAVPYITAIVTGLCLVKPAHAEAAA